MKRMLKVFTGTAVVSLLFWIGGCSDKAPTEDGSVSDALKDISSGFPDGYTLWACDKPGQSCNAHDLCAIDPVCGKDKLCKPASWQNCDDGLDCTVDVCLGKGMCKNTAKPGTCRLSVRVSKGADGGAKKDASPKSDAGSVGDGLFTSDTGGPFETEVRCFKKGERSPDDTCQICNPEQSGEAGVSGSSTTWSGAEGGSCDDGQSCTKNDYCQKGTCKGTSYQSQCQDDYTCTDDYCDGKGGCLGNKLKSTACLINGKCYKDKEKDSTGCYLCDVTKSQSSWTSIGLSCVISNVCYKPKDVDPATKCGECDPTQSTTSWTPLSGLCKINGSCYKNGDKHLQGCAECDTTTSTTSWTVPTTTNSCLISDQCRSSGDPDPTGCSTCDPATDKYAWTSLAGLCLINGTCRKNGDKHPQGCAECDTTTSTTSWTVPATTNSCLISDQCRNSGDPDPTGCSTCDPATDKYAWTTVTNNCLINGMCYTLGKKDPTGCGECDPTLSTTAWTVKGNVCLISGTCHQPNIPDPTGCAICDPTSSKTGWTSVTGKCLIGGTCWADQAPDSTGCLLCDATNSPNAWTAKTGVTLKSYGFESGSATGWTITNSATSVGWVASNKRASSGSYALYYGDPSTGNYNSGATNSGTAKMPSISLTAAKKAGLSFRLYMDTESGTSYDRLQIYVNSTLVWDKDAGIGSMVTMKNWTSYLIDLSSYAGTSVTIEFKFDTVDSSVNSTEGVYLDEIYVWENC